MSVILDLFCGAGGASMGYHQAGFDVVGVDINPQPDYPFEFHQGDALAVLGRSLSWVGAIHASPPCQAYSNTRAAHGVSTHPALIPEVRARLVSAGVPWIIENVQGAPLVNAVRLCGSSFGLGVRRHRLFETSWAIGFAPQCAHYLQPEPIDVTGTGASRSGPRPNSCGGNSRKPRNLAHAREAMGIDWMRRQELSQAIPPAYTEFIGAQLLAHLASEAVA